MIIKSVLMLLNSQGSLVLKITDAESRLYIVSTVATTSTRQGNDYVLEVHPAMAASLGISLGSTVGDGSVDVHAC